MKQKQTHRFDKLAKHAVAPIWEYVQSAIGKLRGRLTDRTDNIRLIKQALERAEFFVRNALLLMAEELFVFPAKLRERTGAVGARETSENRMPLFKLDLEPIEDSVGWMEQSDIHQPNAPPEPPLPTENQSVDCASLNPPYDAHASIERRLIALEDVLTSPGPHAARMRRAMHRQESDAPERITLKSEDDLLLDHCDRVADDPSYYGTEEFARLHKLVLESG